ncbi:MAG: erythromycin esterase family protein [Pseudomonadota bacterium]
MSWIEANSAPIRSITYDEDFADLAFLKDQIGDKTIVQLGESSHGTREFNHVKTRLIKFLHQEMEFDVVAFESGFFDGYFVDANRSSLSADAMRQFIFAVWSTDEVFELFRYVKETQASDRPLRLAGFDVQISSAYFGEIFDFVTALPESGVLSPERKSSITQNLTQYQSMQRQFAQSQCFSGSSTQCNDIIANARTIRAGLMADQMAIQPSAEDALRDMRALYIAVSAAIGQIDNSIATYETDAVGDARDLAMAQTFGAVKERLFPDEKIVIWAHNRHIALEQSETRPIDSVRVYPRVPMGHHLLADYPDELFTIGLYMLRGETADNFQEALPVLAPRQNSLEAIAYGARLAAFYFDTSSDQPREDGNAFLFEPIDAHYWGGSFGAYSFVLSDQYDGVIVIDQSSIPVYR